MKYMVNEPIDNALCAGKKMSVVVTGKDGTSKPEEKPAGEVIRMFLDACFSSNRPTLEDVRRSISVCAAIDKASGRKFIILEDDEHKWLLDKVKDKGPGMWGVAIASLLVYVESATDHMLNGACCQP